MQLSKNSTGTLFFLLVFLLFLSRSSFSQTFNTSDSGSAVWSDSDNWVVTNPSGCEGTYSVPPPTSNAWWPQCPVNIVINRDMTLNANFITTGYVNSIVVNSGAVLTINGNLTLQESATATQFITVSNGGKIVLNELIVTAGNLSVVGEIEASGVVSLGGSGVDAFINVQNGGVLGANQLNIYSSSTLNILEGATMNVSNLSVGNSSTAVFNNYGNSNITDVLTYNGPTTNFGTINVSSIVGQGSSTADFINYGILDVSGNVTAGDSRFFTFPGSSNSTVQIGGNFTQNSNENLVVGTSVDPEPYADMFIGGDLVTSGSGDIRVRRNGRLAVLGQLDGSGSTGGSILSIEDGGQMFVNESILYSGGGDFIDNQNTEEGFIGLYIGDNASITFTGGGSGFVGDQGQNQQSPTNSGYALLSDMPGENDSFLAWLAGLPNTPVVGPLPITLHSFKAHLLSDHVIVQWSTASEKDNHYFTLERSFDGHTFDVLGYVDGAGSTNDQQYYEWVDFSPLAGLNYYRLTQTDFDGTQETFNTIVVQNRDTQNSYLKVYPNPATDFISIQSNATITHVAVYHLSGTLAFQIQQPQGREFSISHLTPGAYIIRVSHGNEVISHKLIKQ